MPSDRILTVMHTPGCGQPAYFSIARDVGGGSSADMGHIAIGEPLRAGQVLRCGACGDAISVTERPVGQSPRQVTVTYRPYLDEVTS